MSRWICVSLVLVGSFTCPGRCAAQTDFTWPIRFEDDIRRDRRNDYRHGTDLEWHAGLLIVPADVVFWREITPGARAELDVNLDFTIGPTAPSRRTEFIIPYSSNRAIVTRITVETPENAIPVTRIQIVNQEPNDAGQDTLLASTRFEHGLTALEEGSWEPSGAWGLQYRYGHLRLVKDGQQVLSAYVPYHKSCAGIMCWQKSGSVGIRSYALRGTERPVDNYTPQQRRTFEVAAAAASKAQAATEAFDVTTAVAEAEAAYNGFEQVLGPDHPYTLQAAGVFGSALDQLPERQADG